MAEQKETVDHPDHYNQSSKYEVLDVIDDWGLNFAEGCVVKYIARYKHKGNPKEDLRKARFYIDFLIEKLEAQRDQTEDRSDRTA